MRLHGPGSRGSRRPRISRRRRGTRSRLAFNLRAAIVLLVAGILPALVSLSPSLAPRAKAQTTSCGSGCSVTIDARDFATGAPLANFNYVINLDNSRYVDPATRQPADPFPKYTTTESNSPIVREGDQTRNNVSLPDGRYLISVRSLDHKMWGKHINLPADATGDALTVRIDLTEQSDAHPLPLGKIRVFVFNDNAWTNGAPDVEEPALQGFRAGLEEQTHSEVTVDYNNNPLCGDGVCNTAANGLVTIPNLGPATYFIDVHPPEGPCNDDPDSQWYQTTTIDGGLQLQAGVEEGSDGTGAPGEQLWEPPTNRTAWWFGFVCAPQPFANPGTGEIIGQARNWQGWPPFDVLTYGQDPVDFPFVALSDAATDRTVFVGRGDEQGNFDILNVPAGTYNLAIWDEQLSYIMRFLPVTVGAGQTVEVNTPDSLGESAVGVSRWFGWLDGDVYNDANGNQVRDEGEAGIPNTDVDQRWRDGSIKEATFTDPTGHYEYPTAEGGPLGKWFINEQGFARDDVTGASVHDEHTGEVTAIPTNQGGALLSNQLVTEGHRATVDWGKVDYPDGKPGQIVGITYWATTRNEFDARFQAHEDYEPAVPDVTVLLETPGPDGQANTDDDVVVNKYVTDHWQHPNASQDPPQGCAVRDATGAPVTGLNPDIGPNCLETPITGEQSKDGAFDGGYAFADYCAGGYDLDADACNGGADPVDLVPGTYVTHVVMPKDSTDTERACNPTNSSGFKNISDPHGAVPGGGNGCLYRVVREEDVNVDLGNKFTPAIPPPPCTGDDHVIDKSTLTPRSTFFNVPDAHAPLCDKRLIELTPGLNANADFNLMTNFRNDPNGEDASDTRTGDVQEPGRIIGLVSNDIYFERNKQSMWYGEPRPIGGIPVGIYQRVDTVPNASPPYTADNWRLMTTVTTTPEGTYEALLPSTETLNCPIPQGPCPGMYLVKVNDPGTAGSPNNGYNPNLLTATAAWDVWPGLTDQLDTPLDPISGTGCEDPAVPARPELLQVSKPYVLSGDSGAARQITIQGDFIGTAGPANATGGRVTLTDDRTGTVTTLTQAAGGGIVSWTPGTASTPDTIVIQVPAINTTTFRPGPKQLAIVSSVANGSVSSANGITIHVLGSNGAGPNLVTYNPNVVNVPPPPPPTPGITDPSNVLQNAINGAAAGSLLVLSPGTYNENVLVWKPLKIQGLGPGGIIGAHELQSRAAEDPRFHVLGSVVDGRYFAQNAASFDATVTANAPYANSAPPFNAVLRGADLTVVAKTASAYNVPSLPAGQDSPAFNGARIDGLGLMTGQGEGAGGVQLQANVNNMQLTNNVLENNSGVFAGGIGLGQPYAHGNHNFNVRVAYDRLIGNGGLTRSGGVGIFYGSNNYDLHNNIVCSNFGVEYGAGVSHWGLSPGGKIRDNQIYYNDAVDSGAGVSIQTEQPQGGGLGAGSGSVNVDRNLIQSNYSGDDGGGIFVLDALTAPINIRDNQIVDNGAADLGGAITLDDSTNVRIVNNTVANNVSTSSSENSDDNPHSAGLASEANDPLFQATLPAGSPDFSNPTALFNNIFWNNNAFTLSQPGPGATLVDQGFLDFEIRGTTNNADTFTPRYSDLTNGLIRGPDGVNHTVPAGQGNIIGTDPGFVTPFVLELTVSGSRLDPQVAAVTITGADPPVGLTGDYHLTTASALVDRGVRCANTPFPTPGNALAPCAAGVVQAPSGIPPGGQGDYDGQARPQLRTFRVLTPWDLGADELPGIIIPIPPQLP
jgi:hypothetical protein